MSDTPAPGGMDGPSDNLTSTSDLPAGVQTVYAGAGNYAAVARFFKKRRIGEFEVDRKDHIGSRTTSNFTSPGTPTLPRVPTDAERGGVDVPRNLSADQFSNPNDPMRAFTPDSYDMQDRSYSRPNKPAEPSSLDNRLASDAAKGPVNSTVKAVRNSGIKAYKRGTR